METINQTICYGCFVIWQGLACVQKQSSLQKIGVCLELILIVLSQKIFVSSVGKDTVFMNDLLGISQCPINNNVAQKKGSIVKTEVNDKPCIERTRANKLLKQ